MQPSGTAASSSSSIPERSYAVALRGETEQEHRAVAQRADLIVALLRAPTTDGQTSSRMADFVIRGGTLVDGTGGEQRVADVAIKDGLISAIGAPTLDVAGAEEVDATGLLVCPGWIDCHTHYDAQVGWDPTM